MWNLSRHESLEMELLNGLNSIKALDYLIFCGGTMLRLCHELNRYSVDLDFWLLKEDKADFLYDTIKGYLKEKFRLKRVRNTTRSMTFDFAAGRYPRGLKIDILRPKHQIKYERKIAFSKFDSMQVMVKAATLEEMMKAKIETFLSRVQIRDAFDIEFLLKRGVELKAPKKKLIEMQNLIRRFKTKDYQVTLGSLLDFKERQFYKSANFRLLLEHIKKILSWKKNNRR